MKRRLLILGLVAVAAFAQIHTAAAQSNSPPFPRVGAYLIGGSIDFASLPHIGDIQMAIFSNYPGYAVGGKNMQQQVAAIKAVNPSIKITAYVKINSMVPSSGSGAFSAQYNANNSNNWWLRTTWPGSAIVTTFGGSENDMNITVPNFRQWMAQYFVGWTTSVASNLDGYFTDNFYYAPRENSRR